MELRVTSTYRIPSKDSRVNQPPTGSSSDPGSDEESTATSTYKVLGDDHMKLWLRLASWNRTSKAKAIFWTLWSLLQNTLPLYTTLTFLLVDQAPEESSDPYEDIYQTIAFHLISCFVRLLIDFSNPQPVYYHQETDWVSDRIAKYFLRKRWVECMGRFCLNFFLILKPYREYDGYKYRRTKGKLVISPLRHGQQSVSREEILSVLALKKKDLEDSSYSLVEVFIQDIPMSLLQLYMILKNNDSFALCSRADFTRLSMIILGIISGAKAVANYNWNYNAYLKTLHFLYHFESSHPINLEHQTLITYVLHVFSGAFLLLHRYYCIAYFLAKQTSLVVTSVAVLFMSQWILDLVMGLKVPFENPPFGAPTLIYNAVHRWINLFTNHLTRYTWAYEPRFRFCGWRIPIPYSLLQIIPFITSMLAVYCVWFYQNNDEGTALGMYSKLIKVSDYNPQNLAFIKEVNSSANFVNPVSMPFSQITDSQGNVSNPGLENSVLFPCVNYTLKSSSTVLKMISKFLFEAHAKISNRFLSFQDIFGILQFLPFSMYFYFCWSFTYSFYLRWFYLNDPMYPVQVGAEFWCYLMRHFINVNSEHTIQHNRGSGGSNCRGVVDFPGLRKLMILTIVDDEEFNGLYHRGGGILTSLFGIYFKRFSRNNMGDFYELKSLEMISKVTDQDLANQLRQGGLARALAKEVGEIKESLGLLHEIMFTDRKSFVPRARDDFESGRNEADFVVNQKLFLRFYSKFENRLKGMTSGRIVRTFRMLGIPLNKLRLT